MIMAIHRHWKQQQGNYVGMTEAEMDAADPKELAAKVKKATDILYQVFKTSFIIYFKL